MQIFVKYNKTLVFNVEPSDLVESIRTKLMDKEGIHQSTYWLTCNGKILDHKLKLSDYNITKESTIYVNPRMIPRIDS